jgi:hypothetical protein
MEGLMWMRKLVYFVAVVSLVASQAAAETAPAPAEGPGPLSKRFPCDAFVKKPDGSWLPTRDVNIELPEKSVITVGPAVSFTPGKVDLGPDVGTLIEQACG